MAKEEIQEGVINESDWALSLNQLMEIKHFFALKNGKIGVMSARRGYGFHYIPLGKESEFDYKKVEDDSEAQRAKLELWLKQ